MRLVAILGVLGVWASSAMANEQVAMDVPEDFHLSAALDTTTLRLREYLPRGQSRDAWLEMLSVQSFPELAGHDPLRFLAGVAQTALQGCEGASADVIAETVENGAPVAVTVMSCPYSVHVGGPETVVTKAISGAEGFHVVQASWRGSLEAEPLQRWLDMLLAVGICEAECTSS